MERASSLPSSFFMLTSKLSKPTEVNPSNKEEPKSNHSYCSFVLFSEMDEISKYIFLPLCLTCCRSSSEKEKPASEEWVCLFRGSGWEVCFQNPLLIALHFPQDIFTQILQCGCSIALIWETQAMPLTRSDQALHLLHQLLHDTDVCTVFTTVIF